MKLTELFKRPASLINVLLEIWEKSVRETHLFLPESEIQNIKQNFLPEALKNITHLIIAQDDERPIAFIGIEGQKLEMLFVTPEYRGKGIATALLNKVIFDAKTNKYASVVGFPVKRSERYEWDCAGPIRLYEKAGFHKISEHGETIIMKKELM